MSVKELAEAVKRKDLEKARALLENGENPNAVAGPYELGLSQSFFGDEIPVFIAACMTGMTEMIELFLARGAGVNATTKHEKYYMLSDDGYMAEGGHALCFACISGLAAVAKFLIDNGADIDRDDVDRRTPLMLASEYGHLEIVKTLVDSGADMSHKDGDFNTALTLACANGYFRVAEYLKEKNAPGKFSVNWTNALFNAVIRRDLEGVKKAIEEHRIPVDSNKWFRGYTPLMLACSGGLADIVRYLASKGADPDATCEEKTWTPLLFAVKSGSLETVRTICEIGCDASVKSLRKALKLAREQKFKDIVEFIASLK